MNSLHFFKENIKQLKIGSSGQASGLCPLHKDQNPSFSCNVETGLWICHGCLKSGNVAQLAELLGVTFSKEKTLQEIARYTYEDENRKAVFQVRRYHPKTFRQFSFNSEGTWIPGIQGTSPILYKLPELLKTDFVYIVEGEKDVESLFKLGLIATCNPMGAGKWRVEYSKYFQGKSVVIIPDQDTVGRTHANQIASSLLAIANEIKILNLPQGKDISEWIGLGGNAEELKNLTRDALSLTKEQINSFVTKEDWPEIIPLNLQKTPQSISLSCLPPNLAKIIHHISEVVQAPAELPLSVALSILAAAIGKRASVQLPTHREVSSLYSCCILEPGSRKSETFKILLVPILEAEERLIKDWKINWRKWRAEADLAEEKIKSSRQSAKKIKDSFGKELLINQITEAQTILEEEPIKPQLWTEDTTSESLRKLVVENGSIGVFSAEGGSVLESFGRYSGTKGADLGIWLAGHAGDPGKATRMRGDASTSSEQLISVCLTAQRQVLQCVGKDKMLRGRGLIDRFLWFIPEDPRGKRNYEHPFTISKNILEEWATILNSILALPVHDTKLSITLNPVAQFLWKEFAKEIEARQAVGGDLRALSGWASKLAGQVGRVALAFHFSEKKSIHEMISEEVISSAINLGYSLIEHAKAAFSLISEDEELSKAKIILEHIQKNALSEIKARHVQQMGWAGCSNSDEIVNILNRLEEHGFLKEQKVEKTKKSGRPSANTFLVNPRLKSFSLKENNSSKRDIVGSVGFFAANENKTANLEEAAVSHEF